MPSRPGREGTLPSYQAMLARTDSFTVELGENGYLIGFMDDYDYPAEMP
ncbi:hypothetical protein [Streptomyces tricolor]